MSIESISYTIYCIMLGYIYHFLNGELSEKKEHKEMYTYKIMTAVMAIVWPIWMTVITICGIYFILNRIVRRFSGLDSSDTKVNAVDQGPAL